MGTRRGNKQGSVRKLDTGEFECMIQSEFLNPDSGKPKRFKRKGATEEEAVKKAKLAMKAWEKGWINSNADIKVKKSRTFGSYMEEYVDTIARPRMTESGYVSYVRHMNVNFYPYSISKLQLHMLNKKVFTDYYNQILATMSEKPVLYRDNYV